MKNPHPYRMTYQSGERAGKALKSAGLIGKHEASLSMLINLAEQNAEGEVDRLLFTWALRENTHPHARKVMVEVSQCDCDMSCWDQTEVLDATTEAVDEYLDRIYDGAEGAVSWRFVPPKFWKMAAEAAGDSHRDLALEAFENGHPHIVYL